MWCPSLSFLASFFTKTPVKPSPYPDVFLEGRSAEAQPRSSPTEPINSLLVEIIEDPKSANCYVYQFDLYSRQDNHTVFIVHIGVNGSTTVDYALECETRWHKAYMLRRIETLDMPTLKEREHEFDEERTRPMAFIRYGLPPDGISLTTFLELMITINNYGVQYQHRSYPHRWFPLLLLNTMDGFLPPHCWAIHNPTIHEATVMFEWMMHRDLQAILEMMRQNQDVDHDDEGHAPA